jgi:peptidoglycan/xylan/chitin deacetylase (PgdA/CDA1 family)
MAFWEPMNPHCSTKFWRALLLAFVWISSQLLCHGLEPIPDKLVVLTFDDSVASHHSVVRPLLKQYGFGATFFITEGFSFPTNKTDYMTWEQIGELHRDGFEIGNHTRDHMGLTARNLSRLTEQVEAINARCAEHGIPRPVSFAYPGNGLEPDALPLLKKLGFRFARRGGAPEFPYEWGRGTAYEPGADHPLLIPSAGDARPDWTMEDFRRAVQQAKNGRIAVLQFHGAPDNEHPWVHTPPARFGEYMKFLHDQGYKVVALRELARFVEAGQEPAEPFAIIEKRKAARNEFMVEGQIRDAATRQALPARLYIHGDDGKWYFPKSVSRDGSAVFYNRRSGFNTNAVEMHTTLSAHPFHLELPSGRYTFTIERGKEYFPESREVVVGREPLKLAFDLRRWINLAEQGWYSGDAHNHRDPAEIPNVMLAEDINVGLPMVDWTTVSTVAPAASDRGFSGKFGNAPINLDATHVWYPRNTEYEIFRVGQRNHTLGAFLIVNHRTRFEMPVLPLQAVAEKARAEGALIDLEKHNWPWSIAIVPLLKVDLFELANNHHWQNQYAITNWAVPAPAWMGLSGSGTDNERDWTLYGFQTYYALLNCGFPLRPTAGTANGVHPVPLGYSRVYVKLDGPFSYDAWIRGLGAGRSFVTTGPMLLAKINGEQPGFTFKPTAVPQSCRVTGSVQSDQPLESIEVIVNGQVARKLTPQNQRMSTGAYETKIESEVGVEESSWIVLRCFETRPGGRFRFAHTAPWRVEMEGRPLRARRLEADWLVQRVKEEIERSRSLLPAAALEEYQQALQIYERIAQNAR